jgi:hypothetical protein
VREKTAISVVVTSAVVKASRVAEAVKAEEAAMAVKTVREASSAARVAPVIVRAVEVCRRDEK